MSDYDVVVIGGGMVGSAAACLFGNGGLRVALIEAGPPAAAIVDDKVDLRVSALSRASQRLLERVGAWQRIGQAYVCAFRAMHVWDAQAPPNSADALHFEAAEIGEPDIGHIVENRRIVAALHAQAAAQPGVELFAPASARRIENTSDRATLTFDDGRVLHAKLVVAADGAGSRTREQAGIETTGWSYEQHGLVTHIATSEPHRETAYQRFLPSGPIALLPLYDGRCSVVWSTTPAQAQRLLELDNDDFHRELCDATDGVLGLVVGSDRRAAFPLRLLHANRYVQPRLALVGDAAHTVHPLAGQGVNLGFADVRHLHDAVSAQSDKGDLPGLRRYERQAKSDNLFMMGSLDALHRLFTDETPVVARLRSAGLALVNRMTPVKRVLIRRAMGH